MVKVIQVNTSKVQKLGVVLVQSPNGYNYAGAVNDDGWFTKKDILTRVIAHGLDLQKPIYGMHVIGCTYQSAYTGDINADFTSPENDIYEVCRFDQATADEAKRLIATQGYESDENADRYMLDTVGLAGDDRKAVIEIIQNLRELGHIIEPIHQ